MSRLKDFTFYICYLVCFAIVSLVIAEMVIGLFLGKSNGKLLQDFEQSQGVVFDFDPVMGWRHKTSFATYSKYDQGEFLEKQEADLGLRAESSSMPSSHFIYTDEEGFIPNQELGSRVQPSLVDREAQHYYFFGGSTAVQGVSGYSKTIPAQVERKFNTLCPSNPKRLINAGVGGYHLFQEKNYAFNEIIHLNPSGYIFYDGWNNAWAAAAKTTLRSSALTPYQMGFLKMIEPLWENESVIRWHLKHLMSAVFPNLYKGLSQMRYMYTRSGIVESSEHIPKTDSEAATSLDYGVMNYRNDLIQSAWLCVGLNLECIFVLQPLMYAGEKPLHKAEQLIHDSNIQRALNKRIITIYPRYEKLYSELDKQFSEYEDIKFVSLVDVFAETPERVYLDTGHLLDRGNFIVAESLSDLLPCND